MTKAEKIANYNPSGVGLDNGKLFGLPFNFEESDIVVLPVPWEVTASYGNGCSKAPAAILKASSQLDLYNHDAPDAWKKGIFMMAVSDQILALNKLHKNKASELMLLQEKGQTIAEQANELAIINDACKEMNSWVFEQSKTLLKRGKKVILLGGDHSTPLGYLQALAQEHKSFGVLQIDAHADLRKAYEGFEFSHASTYYNALELNVIQSLSQVGIRDICEEEVHYTEGNHDIHTFYDQQLTEQRFKGNTWQDQVDLIVSTLPQKVYISFDIDGLDPSLCPNTGTPVPGGIQYWEAVYLLKQVKESGREIIGADLSEVGKEEWDANVGARILYQLCCNL